MEWVSDEGKVSLHSHVVTRRSAEHASQTAHTHITVTLVHTLQQAALTTCVRGGRETSSVVGLVDLLKVSAMKA